MKTYKIILTETKRIVTGTTPNSLSSKLVQMKSEVMHLTFKELVYVHRTSFNGKGNVYDGTAFLSTNNGYSSTRVDTENLEQYLQEELVYEIDLDFKWLRLTAQTLKKSEFDNFERAVKSMVLD